MDFMLSVSLGPDGLAAIILLTVAITVLVGYRVRGSNATDMRGEISELRAEIRELRQLLDTLEDQ